MPSVKVYLTSISGTCVEPINGASITPSSCAPKVYLGSSSSSPPKAYWGISPASNDDDADAAAAKGAAVTGDAFPKENTGSPTGDSVVATPDGAEKSGAGGATGFAADKVFPNPNAGAVLVSLNASGSNCSADGAATRVTGAAVGFACDAMGAETRFSAEASAFAGVAL